MSWYDPIAEDPKGSLEKLAQNRNMSVAELKARHQRIIDHLGLDESLGHLTLNELKRVQDESELLPKAVQQHFQRCTFCQELEKAVRPASVGAKVRETSGASLTSFGMQPSLNKVASSLEADSSHLRLKAVPARFQENLNSAPSFFGQPKVVLPIVALSMILAVGVFNFSINQKQLQLIELEQQAALDAQRLVAQSLAIKNPDAEKSAGLFGSEPEPAVRMHPSLPTHPFSIGSEQSVSVAAASSSSPRPVSKPVLTINCGSVTWTVRSVQAGKTKLSRQDNGDVNNTSPKCISHWQRTEQLYESYIDKNNVQLEVGQIVNAKVLTNSERENQLVSD